jgi:Concanavalin A-like lectin/glucanases superfamily
MDSGGAVVSVAPGFNPQGSWTHLVWTYSTNLGLSSFYVNGVKKASALESGTAATVLNTSVGPLIIGDISQVEFPTNALFNGFIDEVRVYSRALSDSEVKGLYTYETNPQPLKVRPATATAQVVNNFLVGATITDGGYGYTNAPGVTIVGSGGQGAVLSTVVSNEVVIAINIDEAGKHYPSNTSLIIDPPPYPPTQATATASLTNDAVLAVSIVDGGHGYGTTPPPVTFVGSGSGATATATVQNGVVTGVIVTNGGSGYTTAPTVVIGAPQALSSLTVAMSQVRVEMNVSVGYSFQLQTSTDLISWSNVGIAFLATSSPVSQLVDVGNRGQYFRLVQVP